MANENTPSATARRNRMIAIAAGAITVVAIVLAFASGYLGQQWQWLRPAGELLLLAELVGLIVLERHQLFEPVHESVGGLRNDVTRVLDSLGSITEKLSSSVQVSNVIGPREVLRARLRLLREVSVRHHEGPVILR